MKLLIKHIFSLLAFAAAVFWATPGLAQADTLNIYVPDSTFFQRVAIADSLRQLYDAEKSDSKDAGRERVADTTSRFGVVLSIDYGKLLTIPTDFETKYEASAGFILFRRLTLEGTYGSGDLSPGGAYKNVESYSINGEYYKAALLYKFTLNPNIPREFLYLGVGYAMSTYADRGRFLIHGGLWEGYEETFGRQDMEAAWTEVYLITESYLNKKTQRILAGAKISLRIMDRFDTRESVPVYAVPGYGRTFDKTVPALNLYLKYHLPF